MIVHVHVYVEMSKFRIAPSTYCVKNLTVIRALAVAGCIVPMVLNGLVFGTPATTHGLGPTVKCSRTPAVPTHVLLQALLLCASILKPHLVDGKKTKKPWPQCYAVPE